MDKDDFFSFFTKYGTNTQSECNKNNHCHFPKNNEKMVWIPPPKKELMKGVIISRDPTTEFIDVFNDLLKEDENNRRIKLMQNKGVPVRTIIDRIDKICKREEKKFSPEIFSNFLLNNCYWTHLLKCYTYSSRKKIDSFSYSEAVHYGCVDCCTKKWLCQELNQISQLPNVKIIILLGANVTKFVYHNLFDDNIKNWRESRLYFNCPLIPLPHPSRANGKEWAQPKKSLLDNIEKINRICNE